VFGKQGIAQRKADQMTAQATQDVEIQRLRDEITKLTQDLQQAKNAAEHERTQLNSEIDNLRKSLEEAKHSDDFERKRLNTEIGGFRVALASATGADVAMFQTAINEREKLIAERDKIMIERQKAHLEVRKTGYTLLSVIISAFAVAWTASSSMTASINQSTSYLVAESEKFGQARLDTERSRDQEWSLKVTELLSSSKDQHQFNTRIKLLELSNPSRIQELRLLSTLRPAK
jgi:hypothetical protein